MDRNSIKFVQQLLFSREETEEDFLEKVRNGEEIEIPIFRTGTFIYRRGKEPKRLSFNRQFLEKVVENHRLGVVGEQISFDQDHKPNDGATFWVSPDGLSIRDVSMLLPNGRTSKVSVLFAKAKPTEKGKRLILGGEYKYFSSEIDNNFSTSELHEVVEDGKRKEGLLKYGPALVGGGLTNRPFIPNLPSLYSNNIEGVEEKDLVASSTIGDLDGNTYGSFICSADAGESFEMSNLEEDEDKVESVVDVEVQKPTSIEKTDEEPSGSLEDPKEDIGMQFKEIRTKVLTFSSAEDKLSYLSKLDRAELTEPEVETLDMLIEAQEATIKASRETKETLERAAELERKLEESAAKFEEAEKILKQSRAQALDARIHSFSTKLVSDNHHKSAIDAAVQMMRGLGEDTETLKFSVGAGEESKEVDMFEAIETIFAALPQEARLDISENLKANKVDLPGEPTPTPETPTNEEDEIPARILTYSRNYNVSVEEAKALDQNGLVNEDGSFKYSNKK